MNINQLLDENQIFLLEEAVNIGAGNAVTALSQILQCDTDMSLPVLKGIFTTPNLEFFQNLDDYCTSVEMDIVGELQGGLVVIVPKTDQGKITSLIRLAKEEQRGENVPDISIITETSNIMAGVFLTAIHDFCGLNIFHTVPVAENRKSDYLINIIKKYTNNINDVLLVVTNEFVVNKSNIKAYLLVILSAQSVKNLTDAIERTRTELV